jgi:hypothetical protein
MARYADELDPDPVEVAGEEVLEQAPVEAIAEGARGRPDVQAAVVVEVSDRGDVGGRGDARRKGQIVDALERPVPLVAEQRVLAPRAPARQEDVEVPVVVVVARCEPEGGARIATASIPIGSVGSARLFRMPVGREPCGLGDVEEGSVSLVAVEPRAPVVADRQEVEIPVVVVVEGRDLPVGEPL